MEVGGELDRAVAEAIGLTYPFHPNGKMVLLYELIPDDAVEVSAGDRRIPIESIPKYSTDLNAAFSAAERVGLFDATRLSCFLYQTDCAVSPFVIGEIDWAGDRIVVLGDVACGPTPALAICAAVLELKEHKDV